MTTLGIIGKKRVEKIIHDKMRHVMNVYFRHTLKMLKKKGV